MASAPEIRDMVAADADAVARSMARAFFDDPLQEWALPDASTRLDILVHLFATLIEHVDLPYGCAYTDADRRTAAFWVPPARRPLSPESVAALDALNTFLGDAGPRYATAQEVMLAARPDETHMYLEGVGTDPEFQGQGYASAVLAPMLARCDADGMAAYLESTKERNLPLYERLGFRVTGRIAIPDGGPTLWSMWRAPAAR